MGAIISMFGLKQLIERSKEIATERSVGMTSGQTFFVFFIVAIPL